MIVPCKPLLDILNVVKVTSVDSVTIVPSERGWEFYIRDPSNFMMVTAILYREAFGEDYDEEMESFAISLEFFMDSIAKRAAIDMTIDNGFMKINAGDSKAKRRLYALDETPRIMPRIQLKNSVALGEGTLSGLADKKYWPRSSECDTGLEVKVTNEELTFSFESEREGYADTIPVTLANMPDGEQTSHFSPTYLLPALKVLPKDVPILFAMETDKPLIVTATTTSYKIDVFVAPRIGD